MLYKIKTLQKECILQYKMNIQKKENVHSFNQLFTFFLQIRKCIVSINLFFYKIILKECCHVTMKRVTVIVTKLMGTELPSMKTRLPYTITRLPYIGMKFRDIGMNISCCLTGPFLNFTDLSPPVGIVSKQGTKLPYQETELLY
jgi:hypothetical protein